MTFCILLVCETSLSLRYSVLTPPCVHSLASSCIPSLIVSSKLHRFVHKTCTSLHTLLILSKEHLFDKLTTPNSIILKLYLKFKLNKIAFQWDTYHPLVDRIPACTGQGDVCPGGCVPRGCLPRGGVCRGVSAQEVSAQGVSIWGVSAWGCLPKGGV